MATAAQRYDEWINDMSQSINTLRAILTPTVEQHLALAVALLSVAQVQSAMLSDNADDIRYYVAETMAREATDEDRRVALSTYDRIMRSAS